MLPKDRSTEPLLNIEPLFSPFGKSFLPARFYLALRVDLGWRRGSVGGLVCGFWPD